jgi:L-arabinokinase
MAMAAQYDTALMLVAYVSGHGFGHATRVAEVLRVVRERRVEAPLAVVTSGPESIYRKAVPGELLFRSLQCDVGLVQKGALVIDEAATAERCRAFDAGFEALAAAEGRWLQSVGARVVLGDIPPLAFAAAAESRVPSLALTNFSWDWIYRHLARRREALVASAELAARAYGNTALLLELPFAGDLSAFPRRERIPLVARRPRVQRDEARRRLGLDARPAVLVSFGGLGLPGFGRETLADLDEFRFVYPDECDASRLEVLGLGYLDVVAAADVVLTKPGYGIVADAIGAGTRLVYTERGDFPEYPILVREMAEYLPCVHVSNEDLLAGRLREPILGVLGLPLPAPPDLGGAARAAERLLERL